VQRYLELRGKVVVIIGASSGIGRATALAFASQGSSVVLAARRAHSLEEVATECRRLGAAALVVPTDVTFPEQVERLAAAAVECFDRIDIWVNNAAVMMFGRFEDVPLEEFRRVVETNFFGRVYATRAALKQFRHQGRGTLIEVNSVLGKLVQPYASSYIASKFASRGLIQSLRTELFDCPNIHVCSVLPAPVDTPIYQQAANYMGREIRPIWPLYEPQRVARAILQQAVHPRRQIIAGGFGRLLTVLHALSPALTAHLARIAVDLIEVGSKPVSITQGNLLAPRSTIASVSGGWQDRYRKQFFKVGIAGVLTVAVTAAILRRPPARRRRDGLQ
jgi:short-subunit dehydrogenase